MIIPGRGGGSYRSPEDTHNVSRIRWNAVKYTVAVALDTKTDLSVG